MNKIFDFKINTIKAKNDFDFILLEYREGFNPNNWEISAEGKKANGELKYLIKLSSENGFSVFVNDNFDLHKQNPHDVLKRASKDVHLVRVRSDIKDKIGGLRAQQRRRIMALLYFIDPTYKSFAKELGIDLT